MGPKRPSSTPLSGKTLTDNVTQDAQGSGQTGQAGGHPAVYPHQPGRQNPPDSLDQGSIGPTGTPGSSRSPLTGPPSRTSPMVPPGNTSDQDSNQGDSGATNSGVTSGGQKVAASPIGETNMGPPLDPYPCKTQLWYLPIKQKIPSLHLA